MSFNNPAYFDMAVSFLEQDLFSFQLAYYDFDLKSAPPLLNFMIIDSEEVFIAYYRYPYVHTEDEIRIATRHPDIVRLFRDYFFTMWEGAKVLKEGDRMNSVELEKIKQRLNKSDQDS